MKNYRAKYTCDLHTHTIRSDGNDTYSEIIDKAADIGLKVMAITDHDLIPEEHIAYQGRKISTVKYGRLKGIHVILGAEFSCDPFVEDVHIIGMGCAWDDPLFKKIQYEMQQSKIKGYQQTVENLSAHGMKITWEDILSTGLTKRAPEEVQGKHIFECMANLGYVDNWYEGKKLVLNNPDLHVKREKVDPVKVMQMIHETGGVSILAHPYLIREQVVAAEKEKTRDEYISWLFDNGLDGIEAAYTYGKTSYQGSLTEKEIEKEVREKFGYRAKIISGGSDYHNDGVKGVENPRRLGEKGLTWEGFSKNSDLMGLLSES